MRVLALATILLLTSAGCLAPQQAPSTEADGERARPGFKLGGEGPPSDPQPMPRMCGHDDCAWQWLNATIEAEGPFEAWLPLPTAEGGAIWSDWTRNATVTEGDGHVRGIVTSNGSALHVAGNGTVHVQSHFWSGPSPRGNGCCAEAFLDTEWTLLSENRGSHTPRHVLAWTDEGVDRLTLTHEVHSRWCDRSEAYGPRAPEGQGWQPLGPAAGGGSCA